MRSRLKSRWVPLALAACLLVGISGVWALLHPGGLWLQHWRAKPSVVSSRFIFGPYPLEADFVALEKQGVSTIISLLDPSLPYEKVLLAQERALARQHGIEVRNFPMASILGQSFGSDYVANSKAAAQAAIDSKGVAYIHCYLGLHRAGNVRKLLEEYAGVVTTTRHGTLESGRSTDALALERANLAFVGADYEQSLRELATIRDKTYQARLLEAWSNYRLGRLELARSGFKAVAAARPESADALGGLGYCALQSGDLDEAARQFKLVLLQHPGDTQAMSGLGHVRYRQGKFAEARLLFQRVLERYPEDVEVRALLDELNSKI
jgi:tetratricopeptide (TPR) repeat protein